MIDEKTIELFNDLLTNRNKYHQPQYDREDNDGVTSYKYYQHPEFPNDVFLQESWVYDSYGDENLTDLRIVRGEEKIVTIFELKNI